MIPPTRVVAETETSKLVEEPKVAISLDPFGTVPCIQFAAVFQSPEFGLASQVALPAKIGRDRMQKINRRRSLFISGSLVLRIDGGKGI
jgi:hypothetical protein